MTRVRTLIADRGDAGRRLDLVLCRHLADLEPATRTRLRSWIEEGRVAVNRAPVCKAARRVALGDVVTVSLPPGVERPHHPMVAEDVPLNVLYEDDHLLALNKPAGLVVHPTVGHPRGTLMNALLWHAQSWPNNQRPSLVHRLDKLTSGVVIVAKSAAVHAALQRRLASGASAKDYLAVVYGRVKPARGAITLRLRRSARDRRRVVASGATGASSLTRFERLARVAAPRVGLSLLRCRLVTGRMHQIRVHLAASGWPIVGDPLYGEPGWLMVGDHALADVLRGFSRQALHSWRIAFVHPVTQARLMVEAPIAPDLDGLLVATGLSERLRPVHRETASVVAAGASDW